jgi:hypothetical protein
MQKRGHQQTCGCKTWGYSRSLYQRSTANKCKKERPENESVAIPGERPKRKRAAKKTNIRSYYPKLLRRFLKCIHSLGRGRFNYQNDESVIRWALPSIGWSWLVNDWLLHLLDTRWWKNWRRSHPMTTSGVSHRAFVERDVNRWNRRARTLMRWMYNF